MHRQKDIYGKDALEFRPERWQGSELADIGWAYLPFHGGSGLYLGSKYYPQSNIRGDSSINDFQRILP